MKTLSIIAFVFLSTAAHAHAVGHGSAVGAASSSSGQGSQYSIGDEYSAWPHAEMKQYAKPKFEPYRGDNKNLPETK